MNLPISIIPSSVRYSGIAVVTAALLVGCGGSAPPPERERERESSALKNENQSGEKGAGGINFHYTNKSTEARMDIDLGSTDVYLEMSGHPAKTEEDAPLEKGSEKGSEKQGASHPMSSDTPMQSNMSQQQPQGQQAYSQTQAQQNQPQPEQSRAERSALKSKLEDSQDKYSQDEQGNNQDITAKVLQGIRKAQELFYQKRYPEALQMVRQSLDAQPTAEGHALAGSICYMMGKSGLARRHWEDALRLNPDMPAVVNMLERTRTPGGRGSPSPRPISSRPQPRPPASVIEAAQPSGESAPFPEEINENSPAISFDKDGKINLSGNGDATPSLQPVNRPSLKHAGGASSNVPRPAAPSAAAPESVSESAPAGDDQDGVDAEPASVTPVPAPSGIAPSTPTPEAVLPAKAAQAPAPGAKSVTPSTPASKTPTAGTTKPVFPTSAKVPKPKPVPVDSSGKKAKGK